MAARWEAFRFVVFSLEEKTLLSAIKLTSEKHNFYYICSIKECLKEA